MAALFGNDALLRFEDLLKWQAPPRGWLKLIRQALGQTERQQAKRLDISGPTLHKCEQSESEDRITLGQLRKLANVLDYELVYALVPRRPLTDMVQERARNIAMQQVGGVAHSMGLEDKHPSSELLCKQRERRTEECFADAGQTNGDRFSCGARNSDWKPDRLSLIERSFCEIMVRLFCAPWSSLPEPS